MENFDQEKVEKERREWLLKNIYSLSETSDGINKITESDLRLRVGRDVIAIKWYLMNQREFDPTKIVTQYELQDSSFRN